MDKKTTQMIKGIAILIMIAHHFIVIPFSDLPYLVTLFGYACKICVAIYAVLSGYGYFFRKRKDYQIWFGENMGTTSNLLDFVVYTFYSSSCDWGVENNTLETGCTDVWIIA